MALLFEYAEDEIRITKVAIRRREYEIERPLNMLKGDTLIFKAPNSKNKKISRKNIISITNDKLSNS